LPLDAIQEFSIQSQFGSEYGRNSGSVVNIVTRSGTNVLAWLALRIQPEFRVGCPQLFQHQVAAGWHAKSPIAVQQQ